MLLPAAAATPFADLFSSPSSSSAPSQPSYHRQRLFGRQRHSVVQGELLQLYLVVPHSQHVLFPWLFAASTPPPPPSAVSSLPVPPCVVSDVSPCRFHVDVRLRAASVRTEEESEAAPSPPPVPAPSSSAATPPHIASAPQPPTSLSLSSAGALTTSTEPANATSSWSKFATRFGRKSGQSTEKDSANPPIAVPAHLPAAANTPFSSAAATSTASATTAPTAASSQSAPPLMHAQSSPPPVLSPQSAPVGADGAPLARLETRRTRSLGILSPTHIPAHITVAAHSAFQHEPPFHVLPHRPASLTCSPALHHTESSGGGCYQFTLSNGDVVLVAETIMRATLDGHVWLELEVHAPTAHQSLLASLSLPSATAPASSSSSPLPSMAASLRSFMSDHRVLRLPPPHPLAGCLLHISHAVHVHASAQQVDDRVVAEMRVEAHDAVTLESVELLLESARWLRSDTNVSVPVPLSSLSSSSMLPAQLPLSLCAHEEFHFLFLLEPAVSMADSIVQLRQNVLSALDMDGTEVRVGAVDGRVLTSCVVRWRSELASTAIVSQYDVSWQLPLLLHASPLDTPVSVGSTDSPSPAVPSPSATVPPAVALSHPPRVQLHSVFTISVDLHNTSHTALTCTLQLPPADIALSADTTAPPSHAPPLAHSHSLLANQSTPSLFSPVNGLSGRPTSAAPFSPMAGFHFPFHSLANRLPRLASERNQPAALNGHADKQAVAALGQTQQRADARDDGQVVEQGLVCLDGEVDVGVLAGGGRRSVSVQCVAVRCGFVKLPRLMVHVKELDACFVCRNQGVLLVEAGG